MREGNLESLFKTVAELKELKPDFISVTYGAGGGTRDKTIEIASRVINEFGSEALAHLTCVAATQDDIARMVEEMKTHNTAGGAGRAQVRRPLDRNRLATPI